MDLLHQAVPLHLQPLARRLKAYNSDGSSDFATQLCGCVVEAAATGKANGEGLGEGWGRDVDSKGIGK